MLSQRQKQTSDDVTDHRLYLLERRSMLLSGSEKLDSTVQKESDDMLTLTQTLDHRCGAAAAELTDHGEQRSVSAPTLSSVCFLRFSPSSSDSTQRCPPRLPLQHSLLPSLSRSDGLFFSVSVSEALTGSVSEPPSPSRCSSPHVPVLPEQWRSSLPNNLKMSEFTLERLLLNQQVTLSKDLSGSVHSWRRTSRFGRIRCLYRNGDGRSGNHL